MLLIYFSQNGHFGSGVGMGIKDKFNIADTHQTLKIARHSLSVTDVDLVSAVFMTRGSTVNF